MTAEAKRVVLYARVSTGDQTTEQQLHALRTWAADEGHEIVREFVETASAMRGRRPELDALKQYVSRARVDIVAVWAVDRLARSLKDLIVIASDLQERRIRLYSLQEQFDSLSDEGEMFILLRGLLAKWEGKIRSARTKAGLERARREGKRLGRPRAVDPLDADRALILLKAGRAKAQICRELHLSSGSLYRLIRRAAYNKLDEGVPHPEIMRELQLSRSLLDDIVEEHRAATNDS